MQTQQRLTFTQAETQRVEWDGKGIMHVALSNPGVGVSAKLQWRLDDLDSWKDVASTSFADASKSTFLASVGAGTDNLQIGITTSGGDGSGTVIVSQVSGEAIDLANFPGDLGLAGSIGIFGATPPAAQPAALTGPTASHSLNVTFDSSEVEGALDAHSVILQEIKDLLANYGMTA